MSFFIKLLFTASPELIDTLWNVNNNVASENTYGLSRINRYIMECKYLRNNNNV